MEAPSTTFLFDQFRSGRMKHSKGTLIEPELIWSYKLPSFPIRGPEATPALDFDGNLYFGSHDGCFYSLDYNGRQRWFFHTDEKIYSSPLLQEDKIVMAGGDGYCYCFDLQGNLMWIYDISFGFRGRKNVRAVTNRIATIHKTIDIDRKRLWTVKSWSSPNKTSRNGLVLISGYGVGLHALFIDTGELKWSFDLGSPRFHLSGAAVNEYDEIIISSQQRMTYCIDNNGKQKWSLKLPRNFNTWGNPSIDRETQTVLIPLCKRESKGMVLAVDYCGEVKWTSHIIGGIRGSVTISYENYYLACSLDGAIYFINKKTGDILSKKAMTCAKRGLWTSASLDPQGNIFLTSKDSDVAGSLICLNKHGELIWRYKSLGKSLSTPVIDDCSRVYVGSWMGCFCCFQS